MIFKLYEFSQCKSHDVHWWVFLINTNTTPCNWRFFSVGENVYLLIAELIHLFFVNIQETSHGFQALDVNNHEYKKKNYYLSTKLHTCNVFSNLH